MRGWPLLRAFLTLILLLAAGLPLRSLTAPKSKPRAVEPAAPAKEKLTISLTFTQPPEKFSLKFLGEEIIAGGTAASFDASRELEAHFPEEGIDLVFEGTWPGYFQKAGVIVKVTRADGRQLTQTLWGKRTIFELLTFPGKEQP
jgi:hypothetical protein